MSVERESAIRNDQKTTFPKIIFNDAEQSAKEEIVWAMRMRNTNALAVDEANFDTQTSRTLKAAEAKIRMYEHYTEKAITERMCKLMTSLLPDFAIYHSRTFKMKRYVGALLYATIDGYHELSDLYDGSRGGASKLSQTLNLYIGTIIQDILSYSGDVISISGNKLIAVWKSEKEIQWSMQDCCQTAIDCALATQKVHPVFNTTIGINVKIKSIITSGELCYSIIGTKQQATFICIGPALTESQFDETRIGNGEIYCAQSAWSHVDYSEYNFLTLEHGVKVLSISALWKSRIKSKIISLSAKPGGTSDEFDLEEKKDLFQIRPSIHYAIKNKLDNHLAKFMIRPIMDVIKVNDSLENLTEMRHIVTLAIQVMLDVHLTEKQLVRGINKCYRRILTAVIPTDGHVLRVFHNGIETTFTVLYGLRGAKHYLGTKVCLRTALACFQALKSLRTVKSVAVGVTSGMAYVGTVGHALRREYSVISTAFMRAYTLAYRYQDQVVCDKNSFLICKMDPRQFVIQPHRSLDGIIDIGSVYRYLPREQIKQKVTKPIRQFPIIGREAELQVYKSLLTNRELRKNSQVDLSVTTTSYNSGSQTSKSGTTGQRWSTFDSGLAKLHINKKSAAPEPVLCTVTCMIYEGRARIGKTRLTEEIIYITPADVPIFRVQLFSSDKLKPYNLIRTIFNVPLGFNNGVTYSTERQEKLATMLSEKFDSKRLWVLNDIFRVTYTSQPTVKDDTDDLRRKAIVELGLQCFIRRWVIIIDDMNFADKESWPLLEALLETGMIFVVMTTHKVRAHMQMLMLKRSLVYHMFLMPLNKYVFGALACQFLRANAIPGDLERMLQVKSSGNPGWIENCLVNLVHSNQLLLEQLPLQKIHDYGLLMPPQSLVTREGEGYITTLSESELLSEKSGTSSDFDFQTQWKIYETFFRDSKTYLRMPAFTMPKASILVSRKSVNTEDEDISRTSYVKKKTAFLYTDSKMAGTTLTVCLIAPGGDISNVTPEVSNEITIIKLLDDLTTYEQTILKCASIIGDNFSRDMLFYLMNYTTDLRESGLAIIKLFDLGIIGCSQGDFMLADYNAIMQPPKIEAARDHLVFCKCVGIKVPICCGDLPNYANCGYMRFKLINFRQTTYSMLTNLQRQDYHAKAIKYLESKTKKCIKCGGGYFGRILGNIVEINPNLVYTLKRKFVLRGGGGSRAASETSILANYRHVIDAADDRYHMLKKTSADVVSSGSSSKTGSAHNSSIWHDSFDTTGSFGRQINTIRRQRGREILVRTFSKINFTECDCQRILDGFYKQLLEHTEYAEHWHTWMLVILEYSTFCAENLNIAFAMELVERGLSKIEENSARFVTNGEVWRIPFMKARLYAIDGVCRLELGLVDEAEKMLLSGLQFYGEQFPTWNSCKGLRIRLKNKAMFGRRYFKSTSGHRAEYNEELSKLLCTLFTVYLQKRHMKNAYLAACWGMQLSLRAARDFQLLIRSCANLLNISIVLRKVKLMRTLENRGFMYCFCYRVSLERNDLKAIFALYSNIFVARFFRMDINYALQMGGVTINIARGIQAEPVVMHVLPLYVHLLILSNKALEAASVILEFEYALTDYLGDQNGETWFYALCLTFHIDTGFNIIPFSQCENVYYLKQTTQTHSNSVAVQRYFTLIWLWYLRTEQYENAMNWGTNARTNFTLKADDSIVNIVTGLYYVEALIHSLVYDLPRRNMTHIDELVVEIQQTFKLLVQNGKYIKSIMPRVILLQAFYKITMDDTATVPIKLLDQAVAAAYETQNEFDLSWIIHNKMAWSNELPSDLKTLWLDHATKDILDYHMLTDDTGIACYTLQPPTFEVLS